MYWRGRERGEAHLEMVITKTVIPARSERVEEVEDSSPRPLKESHYNLYPGGPAPDPPGGDNNGDKKDEVCYTACMSVRVVQG